MGKNNELNRKYLCNSTTPVVVMRIDNHLGLGVARSLGRFGVPVYGISPLGFNPAVHSRYFQKTFFWDVDGKDRESTVRYLLSLGKRIGRKSLLIHTSEDSAILLAEYSERLSEWFIYQKISPELVRSLSSKKEMYFLAKKWGIPTAETFFPRSIADVEECANKVSFPVMLKGIDGIALERRTGKKMFIVRTKKELLRTYTRFEDQANPDFMIQEFIPGNADSVWMFDGYFNKDSECLFGVTGKKIRQFPPYTGATSLGICLENAEVFKTTKRFMKQIGYAGILDIGYKFDNRDEKYKVLDVNPRIGASFRLFVGTGGIDVIRAEYLDLTELIVPPSKTVANRKWLVENYELFSTPIYFRDGVLSLQEWLKSFKGVRELAWLSLDDPMPFFLTMAKLLKGILRARMSS
jgi:D-aspartate ligase